MKKIGIIVISIVAILIIGVVILISSNLVTRYDVMSINVSTKSIDLKLFPDNSGACYWGYKSDYRDDSLYIKIKCKIIPLPMVSKNGFIISIPNKYEKLKEIYLYDDTTAKNILIWQKDKK